MKDMRKESSVVTSEGGEFLINQSRLPAFSLRCGVQDISLSFQTFALGGSFAIAVAFLCLAELERLLSVSIASAFCGQWEFK